MTEVQNRKKLDLDKGFGITKKDKIKAVAVDYVIDADKRIDISDEPRFTE